MTSWPVSMMSLMTSLLVSSAGATLWMSSPHVLPGPPRILQGPPGALGRAWKAEPTPPRQPGAVTSRTTCPRGALASGTWQPPRDALGPAGPLGILWEPTGTSQDLPGTSRDLQWPREDLLWPPGNLQTTPEVPCGSLGNLWGSPGIWWGLPSPLRGRWSHRCLAGPVPWDPPAAGGGSCPQGCHPRDRTRPRGQTDPQGDTGGYLVCEGLRSVQGAVGPTQPPSVLRGFFWGGQGGPEGTEQQRHPRDFPPQLHPGPPIPAPPRAEGH